MPRKPKQSLLAEVRPRFLASLALAIIAAIIRLVFAAGAAEQRLSHVEQDVRELQQERRNP